VPVVDRIPASDVKDSAFDVQMELEVPEGFWDEEGEPEFLKFLYDALVKRGWGHNATESVYSFFNEAVQPDRDDPTVMKFTVWIAGDYLVEHPKLFADLEKLSQEGLLFPPKPKRTKRWGLQKSYGLVSWYIYADRGPLEGVSWDGQHFVVAPE